jgi:uncharacterized protein YjiK
MKRTLILILFILTNTILVFCGEYKNEPFRIVKEYKINVPEPSDLALSIDGKSLWTVSDQNSTVYLISLSGKIEKSFTIDAEDLEGVTVINESTIAVVSERSNEIILLNTDGKEISRHNFGLRKKGNVGLEGITVNKSNEHVFVVKEKKPRLLIELDKKFNELNRKEINFVNDLSGLDYVENTNDLWIISDESKLVAKCSPDGTIKEKFNVNITQIEGIAVDVKSKKIYLVSDKEEKLYVLEMK